MGSKILITNELFIQLVMYHLVDPNQADTQLIRTQLQDKLDRLVAHDQYTKSLFNDDKTQA